MTFGFMLRVWGFSNSRLGISLAIKYVHPSSSIMPALLETLMSASDRKSPLSLSTNL